MSYNNTRAPEGSAKAKEKIQAAEGRRKARGNKRAQQIAMSKD